MLNPISTAFIKAKQENRPALLTYTVAGDSSKIQSLNILKSISKKYPTINFGNVDSLNAAGSVFLKGNQKTGNVFVRSENGLGEGILITCQHDDVEESNTFGPLPLDFFHD